MRLMRVGAGLLCLLWAWVAMAAATTHSVTGDVQLTPMQGSSSALATGQRVEAGATVKTAGNAQAVLRFDDGQMIALAGNSTFVINDYKFNAHKPEEGSFVASLLRGGLRAVTGIIGESKKENVTIKGAVATMGIRGTDFMLFLDQRLFLIVLQGAVAAGNDAGEEVFDEVKQPLGLVASSSIKARRADGTEFPAEAQAAFRQLEALSLSDRIRKPDPKDPTCGDRRTR
jgi:hypothetical protein